MLRCLRHLAHSFVTTLYSHRTVAVAVVILSNQSAALSAAPERRTATAHDDVTCQLRCRRRSAHAGHSQHIRRVQHGTQRLQRHGAARRDKSRSCATARDSVRTACTSSRRHKISRLEEIVSSALRTISVCVSLAQLSLFRFATVRPSVAHRPLKLCSVDCAQCRMRPWATLADTAAACLSLTAPLDRVR